MVSMGAPVFLALWYFTSMVTLFLNKYILSELHAPPQTLAVVQMLTTCVLGAAKVYAPALCKKQLPADLVGKPARSPSFYKDMFFVGFLRFSTVMLGLVSLAFVPVSFTETIKSSAPFFTVIFALLILGEQTSNPVKLSLIPIAAGLALASATELEFNTIGFLAALMNNCLDCVQNVFSKKLLNGRYTFVELQYYTSAAALMVQVPLWVVWYWEAIFSLSFAQGFSKVLVVALAVDATSYHLQSVFAYGLMSLISPVTQSVANTIKRALLIWLSIMFWGNPVTPLSIIGTGMVVVGVFLYNAARQRDAAPLSDKLSPTATAPSLHMVDTSRAASSTHRTNAGSAPETA